MRRWTACAALAATLVPGGGAFAEPPAVHALVGARIVVEPGRVIESGTIVIRDGVIEAVGAAVQVPADASRHELEGLTVYPGLIDPYVERSNPESPAPASSQGGHANPLVRPENDVLGYALTEEQARKLREAGFTTALMAPAEGVFRGTGALVNLGDGDTGANLLRRGVGQFAAFESRSEGYPRSLMGAVALFRQTLLDAAWYENAQAVHRRYPSQARPRFDGSLESLAGVLAGEQVLVIESPDALGTLRAAAVLGELGAAFEHDLAAWVVGHGEEYQWLAEIAAAGLPHLLPVAFPDEPAVPDEDDMTLSLAELRHWDAAPSNPGRLLEAGVDVAFTSHGLSDPKKIHGNLERAVAAGLSPERALAAMTTTPARLLGIADRAGKLSAGRMANLVVSEGELFRAETKIRELWIDGRRYEVQESKPPEVEPAGIWVLTVETPDGQQIPATLELSGEAVSLSGTVSTGGGPALALSSVTVSGRRVEVAFDSTSLGMPGTTNFTLEITGDSAAGNGTSPQGPFTLSGSRSSRPEVSS